MKRLLFTLACFFLGFTSNAQLEFGFTLVQDFQPGLEVGFDLTNVLVFPTDLETKELAEGLGIATFYEEKVSFEYVIRQLLSYIVHEHSF